MNSEKLLARLILRNALARRNYASYGGRKHPVATMNDMPTPQGDFFIRHAANQRRYNAIFGVGVVTFVTSLYTWLHSDAMSLNWAPPESIE